MKRDGWREQQKERQSEIVDVFLFACWSVMAWRTSPRTSPRTAACLRSNAHPPRHPPRRWCRGMTPSLLSFARAAACVCAGGRELSETTLLRLALLLFFLFDSSLARSSLVARRRRTLLAIMITAGKSSASICSVITILIYFSHPHMAARPTEVGRVYMETSLDWRGSTARGGSLSLTLPVLRWRCTTPRTAAHAC